MSSRFERLGPLGSVFLFIAFMAASSAAYKGMTPLWGAPATSPTVSQAVDRAVQVLSRAKRPMEDVVFSESLKAFVPDVVPLSQGAVLIADAKSRPVLIVQRHAGDYPLMLLRAQHDGLGWATGIAGTEVVAFAANEAAFQSAMRKAGLRLAPSDLHSVSYFAATGSPLLSSLQSQVKGVKQDAEGWSIPAHSGDGLMLYGPYVDLSAGSYRVTIHAQILGSPGECRAAKASFHPVLSVTRDAGSATLKSATPAAVRDTSDDPCELTLETAFAVPEGAAHRVETPLSGSIRLPMRVDGYTLNAEPAAHSR